MPRKYVVLLALALGVILLDQWTKYVVLGEYSQAYAAAPSTGERLGVFFGDAPPAGWGGLHYRPREVRDVVPGYLRLHYTENPGAAWGLFRSLPPNVRGPLFHVVSLGAVVLILYYFRKLAGVRSERFALVGLPLVLGGALGNYIDRLARGFVIDFVQAHWQDRAYWPSFNVADMAIVVGVALLLIDGFVRPEHRRAPAAR